MNKTALITGASRGIGFGIATEFAKAGYDLYLISLRSEDKLATLKETLEQKYAISCHISLCDVSDYSSVQMLFSDIKKIDVLVNNAGISYIGLLQDMEVDTWKHVLDVNLNSCFYTSKCAIPLMLSSGSGRIINISSVWGSVGASMEVAYSASKGAINSFTKALAKELAPSNIQVNAVAFGVIDTDMNRCFSQEERMCLQEEIPADRFGTCEEAGRIVLQLAQSPEYLTGQIITMDGGWI